MKGDEVGGRGGGEWQAWQSACRGTGKERGRSVLSARPGWKEGGKLPDLSSKQESREKKEERRRNLQARSSH